MMAIMRTTKDNKRLCERFPWLKNDPDYKYIWVFDDLPIGWEDLALDMVQEIDDELGRCDCRDQFEIIEVKEKYGMLRVYWIGRNPFPDECNIGDIILKYQKMSGYICPGCGRYKNPIKWVCERCVNDN